MDRKELIKKISNLLQTFDLVTLLAIYRTLKRVQKGAVNEKDAEIAEITAQLFHKEETAPETYNFLIELNKYLLQLDETQMQAVLDMIRKLNAAISKGEK